MIGRTLGRYEIVRRVGEGGSGKVCAAERRAFRLPYNETTSGSFE